MNRPKIGEFYTVRQIFSLDLTDTPHLLVPTPERFGFKGMSPVQDPDQGWEAVLGLIGEVVFEYRLTTDELIPVFHCVDDPIEIENGFDFELDLLPYFGKPSCWVVPKGDTRKQDYHWVEEGVSIASEYTEPQPAPEWMVQAYNAIKSS